ncbi:hypothetical protein A0H81_00265 [Grifola frondosa]|uniref:Uncharacterized protein n=1 Tax=Grifola frondosa TaxID=5627 RepID=A0A1C7MT09_GRIFR|nr:hypothetical protein A0H81_00265 [Grifola frondosa]
MLSNPLCWLYPSLVRMDLFNGMCSRMKERCTSLQYITTHCLAHPFHMRFTVTGSLSAVLSALLVTAASCTVIDRRQVQSPFVGTISTPADGTTIGVGETFAFNYSVSDWCHSGYSPLSVWLVENSPVFSDLNSTGQFPEGEYLYYFGDYLVANFAGLPPMGTPPPSALTMPELNIDDGNVYLAVVETFYDCPPNIPVEYGVASNQIEYEST